MPSAFTPESCLTGIARSRELVDFHPRLECERGYRNAAALENLRVRFCSRPPDSRTKMVGPQIEVGGTLFCIDPRRCIGDEIVKLRKAGIGQRAMLERPQDPFDRAIGAVVCEAL